MTRDIRLLLDEAVGRVGEGSLVDVVERGRRNKARRWAGVALILLPALVMGTYGAARYLGIEQGSGNSARLQTSGGQHAHASRPGEFFASAVSSGVNEVLPISFVDGSRAEMVYAPELALDEMSIQPNGNVGLVIPQKGEVTGETTFRYAPGDSSGQPVAAFPDVYGGTIKKWEAEITRTEEQSTRLRVGPWKLEIAAGFSESEQQVLVSDLKGLETGSGFLMLEGKGPVRVWGIGDYPGIPELYFGDLLVLTPGCVDLQGQETFTHNELEIHNYGGGSGEGYFAWCDATRQITVGVYGARATAEEFSENLSFRTVMLSSNP